MSTATATVPSSTPAVEPDGDPRRNDRPVLKLVGILVGVPVVLIIMLLCFLAPSLNSGAHDLPLAVSGPEEATSQIRSAIEDQSPGAFAATTYDSAADARDAVADRREVGAISVTADGVEIIVAGGAGTPYAALLRTIGAGLEATGQTVTYEDVAPLTENDPNGAAIAALGLPLAFGGNVSAILLLTLLKRYPRLRLVGGVLMSLTGGFATVAVLQYGFQVIDGNFLFTATALSLGIAAICLTLQGLYNLAGMTGLGIAAVLLLFVSNPLAGLAAGPQWLPAPWGAIGQLLPIGAAGTAVRSGAFFDGAGAGQALLVLGIWAAVGFVMSAVISRRKHAQLVVEEADAAA